MPELIVTSRYLKSGSKKNLKNYVKYIATREGVVLTSCERENYIGYLANRPGAVRFNSHGLFNEKNEPINLERTAKEIVAHGGNVWTHVVSLRRDNAQAMGYDNLNAWRELVKRQIPNIAKNQKIDLKNLKWYAAFHDKETNPHVHIIVYSSNEREGFLTNRGIEKIRSGFAKDIYADELHHLYAQQTDLRNALKKESEGLMKRLAENIAHSTTPDGELMKLILKLHTQLSQSKGKKVYGYLKSDAKKTVDEIFAKLADNEAIQKMYALWCEAEQRKHDVYSSAKVQFPSLVDNRQFKSVKNMIIRTVLGMGDFVWGTEESKQVESEGFTAGDFSRDYENTAGGTGKTSQSSCYLKWSDNYKKACKLTYDKKSGLEDFQKAEQLLLSESKSGNVLADYDLGKLYATEKLGAKDKEKSQKYYSRALKGFLEIEPAAEKLKPYLQYRIGKMHCYGLGTKQDYTQAFAWFLKSSEQGNRFAQFSLANLYYYGSGVEKNLSQAFLWYMKSAAQGQPYAAYSIAHMYSKGEYVAEDKEMAQRYYKRALSGFLELERTEQADDNLFYKIGMMYKNGLGTAVDVTKSIDYFQRSAENKWSSYQLGKLYLFGAEGVEKDKSKAAAWLSKSADDGNEYAGQLLDSMDKFENVMLANAVVGLFVNLSRCIEEDYMHKRKAVGLTVDRKLRRVIGIKKKALGVREDFSQSFD